MTQATSKKIDYRKFYWESIRRFDTISTISIALTSKLENIKKEHPEAIIDIQTIANLLIIVLEECTVGLEGFEMMKKDTTGSK